MAISIEAREDLVTLVVGMFDAAPGAAVLTDLTVAYEAGIAAGGSSASVLNNIAISLASSSFYKEIYPEFLTNSEFVVKLVNNLAGDTLDATTKADAQALLLAQLNGMDTSNAATKAAARAAVTMTAIAAIESASAEDETFGDLKKQFTNKVEVASYYSVEKQQNITGLEDAQDVIKDVDATDASVDAAKDGIDEVDNSGNTYELTVGVNNFVGTNADDTFNALSVNSTTGADATTFNAFDSIDGGDGEDTLNIYTHEGDGLNNTFSSNTTVKNVEIVNIYQGDTKAAATVFGDASKYTGVEQLWQIGDKSSAVTNLGAATAAGFRNSEAGTAFNVTPTATAASASVAFDGASNVGDTSSLTVNTGTALNTVNISGSLKSGSADLDTTISTGASQTSLTLNSAIDVDLTLNNAKNLDASGSTGSIEFTGGNAATSIKSGSGADVIGTTTATSATVSSTVETGAGKDSININNTGSGTTTVNAGEGDDSITIQSVGSGVTTVSAGAGDDTVTVNGGVDSIKTTDAYDGGEGTDTLSVAGKVFDAEDYIILTDVVTGFESLKVTGGTAATINASKLTGYTSFDVATTTASTLTKVAAGQSVKVSDGGATVSANGYVAPSGGAFSGTLAGTLNISSTDSGNTITANGEIVNLTVAPASSNNNGKSDTLTTTLTGDAKTANITLTAKTDNNGTATVTTDDVYEDSNVVITTDGTKAGAMDGLTTVTLSGNGTATITNAANTALATVDASGLASVTTAGAASAGLTYDTANGSVAETITLGSALDDITVENSTYLTTDTITGLSLVAQTGSSTKVDTNKSDDLTVEDGGAAITNFAKATTTQTSLNLALVDLAAGTGAAENVVFQLGGDTYIYADQNNDDILNDSDIVIKLTGSVDLDLLVDALNS